MTGNTRFESAPFSAEQLAKEILALPSSPLGPHPLIEEIVAFGFDDSLPDETRFRVRRHIESCCACAETLELLLEATESTSSALDIDTSRDTTTLDGTLVSPAADKGRWS